MKLRTAIAVAFIALAPLQAQADDAANVAAQSADAFHDALQRGDRDAVLALLDDNVQIYEQGWVERSKAEYAEHHLDSDISFAKATRSVVFSRSAVTGVDLCYLTRELRTKGLFEGKTVNSITLETMILRRIDNAWKIVHIHWSSRKPKET